MADAQLTRCLASAAALQSEGHRVGSRHDAAYKVRGPLGLAPVAALITEGAVSRFGLARQVERTRPRRELIQAVGTAA